MSAMFFLVGCCKNMQRILSLVLTSVAFPYLAAATDLTCGSIRDTYRAECCGQSPSTIMSLTLAGCNITTIGCDTCPTVAGTASNFESLLLKPQMCVSFPSPRSVGGVRMIPRQMAFDDAVAKGIRVDFYSVSNSKIYAHSQDITHITTTLDPDPYGRAPLGPMNIIDLTAQVLTGVSKVCVTITSILEYAPPSSETDYTAWGTDASGVAAYTAYVKQGTWNVGLVSFGILETNTLGTALVNAPRSVITEITQSEGGSMGGGYSARDAVDNNYGVTYYSSHPTTPSSWSWSGAGTLNAGGVVNYLVAC